MWRHLPAATLVSMARSQCVNPNSFTLNLEFFLIGEMTYIQSSFEIQSNKAALHSILIQCSHYAEEWVVNKLLNLQP